jgi:hypothetical protein
MTKLALVASGSNQRAILLYIYKRERAFLEIRIEAKFLISGFKFLARTRTNTIQIQTQMTQKPMLRAEVYARALRASQNRTENSLQKAGSITLPSPLVWKLFCCS